MSLNEELANLRARGLTLPRNNLRAVQAVRDGASAHDNLMRWATKDLDNASLKLGRPINADNYDSPEVQSILKENQAMMRAMGSKRALSGRMTRQSNQAMGGDVYAAIPRFYDPLEYWDLSGLPWNVADEGHRHKLHKWLRLYYATHYLIPQLVDIFTRFPLIGMELECKDPALKKFYEELFFDQLDYGEFLVSLGREFWVVGEAFSLGSFDEDLAIWESEELINPEDVTIQNFPMLKSQQLKIVPPDYLKKLVQTKSPAREWRLLQVSYPELIPYLLRGEHIPVSPVLLKQVANKLNDWDDHGTPILLRGLRTLLHEEKLLASQDAIAERLYSPLILAKLGIQDMGDNQPPWIPGPEELDSVRDDFDMALTSDFRLMVHHFGLDVSSVFGREQMPRLGDDFDRIERRLMQVFGVNPSLLSAGSNSQPYASSALQAEFLNQILKTFQNTLKRHFRERALVVAEAQRHYDYEVKGESRIKIYEDIVKFELDGTKKIERVQKLLIPDLKFVSFDMRDEATQRNYLIQLREMGVPIPSDKFMIGFDWDYKEMILQYNKELEMQTIEQQQAKMNTYTALVYRGLPVPLDLKTEVESVLTLGPGAGGGMPQGADPNAGGGMGGPPPPAPPGGGPIMMPPPPDGLNATPGGGAPAIAPNEQSRGTVPEASNERRQGLRYNTHFHAARKGNAVDDFMTEHYVDGEDALGLPFTEYIFDNHPDPDPDLDNVTYDEVKSLYNDWPKHAQNYRHRISSEILARFASLNKQEEAATLQETPDEWVPKPGEELVDIDGEEVILAKSKTKTPRVITEVPEGKKYSIIDPEADELEEG